MALGQKPFTYSSYITFAPVIFFGFLFDSLWFLGFGDMPVSAINVLYCFFCYLLS